MLGLRLVEEAHKETLHGGVGQTMAKVRTHYWIQKFKKLVKKMRKNWHGCKRFQASAYAPADYPHSRNQPISSDSSDSYQV